ncbi:gene transfer agent family protein [Alteraurantiacibacter aquimixticola]|uniref:Gene transfer agent family protein n=1 Tax=Alteraurantiacibacter aquimixticola TaxID=2489173 RepID=A0A4V4U958_9SPHN|nr:gene transfer agent family protein [Alteraurantiacibacter aquimixticola]TIX49380.1 gene transfer agent family protein [Alteraurantiacibacter aquimixticola]
MSLSETPANPERGEALLLVNGREHILRPSFAALVAAEEELGPLFALVERAGEGRLSLQEIAALFHHCCQDRAAVTREQMGEGVLTMGLASAAVPLRMLLKQILQGRG